jgi:hypothetical protein
MRQVIPATGYTHEKKKELDPNTVSYGNTVYWRQGTEVNLTPFYNYIPMKFTKEWSAPNSMYGITIDRDVLQACDFEERDDYSFQMGIFNLRKNPIGWVLKIEGQQVDHIPVNYLHELEKLYTDRTGLTLRVQLQNDEDLR